MSQSEVVIYTKRFCPYCIKAKHLLDSLSVNYQEIPVDGKPELQDAMAEKAGGRTVPQIFIAAKPIGGCDDLHALHRANNLEVLIFPSAS